MIESKQFLCRQGGWRLSLSVIMLALVLAGCNSGSGSGSNGDSVVDKGGDSGNDAPTIVQYPAPATLEFFILDEGGLYALAPSSPTAPILVDDKQGGKFDVSISETAEQADDAGLDIDIQAPVFSASSEVLPVVAIKQGGDARVNPVPYQAYMFYRREDGSYWRVSTDVDTFPPQPVQVSATHTKNKICNYALSTDVADPLNTAFVYGTLVSGSSCTDAQRQVDYFVLRLADGTTTPARDFPDPQPLTARQNSSDDYAPFDPRIITLHAPGSGRINGWLIRQNDELVRLNNKAEVVQRDIAPVNVFVASLGQLDNGTVMLNIDDSLWAFDPSTNQAKNLGYQFKEDETGALTLEYGVVDGNRLFFQDYIDLNDRRFPGNAVYRVAKNSEGDYTVELIDRAEEPVTGLVGNIQIGQDRIVWYYQASNSTPADFRDNYFVLRSVPKTATGPVSGKVIGGGSPGEPMQIPFWTSAERVFYNTAINPDSHAIFGLSGEPVAHSVRLDGSGETRTLHALWSGMDATQTRVLRVDNVMQVEGSVFQRDLGGKPLKAVPTAQAGHSEAVINLGTLPDPQQLQSVSLFSGYGPGRLAVLEIAAGGSATNAQYDLVYFDITKPGSVTQVTNTADKDELAITGFGLSASVTQ